MPLRILTGIIIILASLSLFLTPLAAQTPGWVLDGDSLNINKTGETSLAATPHALAPSLTLKGSIPYISWSEINDKGIALVYVAHKQGNEWIMANGPLNLSITRNASTPSAAIVGSDLYVAWSEADPKNILQINVKKWDGKEWILVGGGLNFNPENHASNPVIEADGSALYITWIEINPSGVAKIYVKLWDGNSWKLLGNSLNKSLDRHGLTPSISADKDNVYLAWAEYDEQDVSKLYVNHWNGSIWEDAGGVINVNQDRYALSPSLSMAGSIPYIAWMEYDSDGVSQVYVKRYDGKEWRQIGDSLNIIHSRPATSPSIAMKGNIPYAAWTEINEAGISGLFVKHWKGSSWVLDGPSLNINPDGAVTAPSIATEGGTVYAGFSEMDTNNIYRLYVKRLEGSADFDLSTQAIMKTRAQSSTKKSSIPVYFKSTPKDFIRPEELLPPPLAYKYLPRTAMNEVDWMGGIRDGLLKPFDSTDPDAKPPLIPANMETILPIKKSFGIPDVIFPHSSHAMWLDCRNCHPTIFTPKRGGNPITMHKVIEGEYCGRCHGVVAFRIFDCFRCHSREP
ncbi:MAG: hypothetical protein A2035_00190 [Nitrospirae bacterium GWA2_42_11]|nr:MAG: hypothetical protein A2035_00190 [Nitrospirae bacterium GWA2_42_11]